MDERERLRLQRTRLIAKLLKRRSFRDALPTLRDGIAQFVVGLPDDTLRQISDRVDTLGGEAHLVVVTPLDAPGADRVRVLRVSACDHKPLVDLDDQTECAVNENTTLAMLMNAIEVGQELTYYTYDSETVIRFINDSIQPIPA